MSSLAIFVNQQELKARDSDGNEADAFVNPRAPIHVVNGVGGNNEGSDILMLEGGPNTAKHFRVPPWSAFRLGTYSLVL